MMIIKCHAGFKFSQYSSKFDCGAGGRRFDSGSCHYEFGVLVPAVSKSQYISNNVKSTEDPQHITKPTNPPLP